MQSWWRRAGSRGVDRQERLSVSNCDQKGHLHLLPSSPEKIPDRNLFRWDYPHSIFFRAKSGAGDGTAFTHQTRFDLAVGDVRRTGVTPGIVITCAFHAALNASQSRFYHFRLCGINDVNPARSGASR
jgi:hypothetical protein